MSTQGFRAFNDDLYVYQENTTNNTVSASMGIDSAGTGLWCIATSTAAGSKPNDTGNRNFTIDPTLNGDVTISANGGNIVLASPVQLSGGVTLTGDIITLNSIASTAANSFIMEKNRSGGVITSGDALGQIYFKGFDGSAYVTGASITSTSSGTIAANRVGSNLIFSTHPDSASGLTPTTRLTIAPTGAMTIAAPDSGVGLTISGGGLTVTGTTTLNTALTVPNGGTGASTLTGILTGNGTSAFTASTVTQHGTVIAGTSNTVSSVAPSATSGVAFISQGAAADPVFGTVVVAGGGTGATTLTGVLTGNGTSAVTASTITQHGTVIAGASNAVSSVAPSATSGVPFISQGAAADPAFGTAVVAGGGTGITSATAYAVLCGGTTSTNPLQSIASVGTSGHVLTSNGAAALPTFQAIPASGVTSLAGTANQITASAATGAVTLSIPNPFIAPGTIAATTTVTAGTDLISTAGNLSLPTVSSTVGQIKVNSATVMHTFGTSNVFIGDGAGNFTTTGSKNQGIGTSCLAAITNAVFNTCVGYQAGKALTTGSNNVFIGNNTGQVATTTGDNICIGDSAGALLATGSGGNTIVGPAAGQTLATGANNTLIGLTAGFNFNAAETGNIILGLARGNPGDDNVTRIGYTGNDVAVQTKCFIDGVVGKTTDVNDAVAVLVSSTGQFGTVSSSIRYKENVVDMADSSSAIMNLRPVSFNFKTSPDIKRTGFIAEEVEAIMPELVAYNQDGQVESVKYHELPALLLNELQKAVKMINDLQARVAALEAK